jgi:cobalt/nickel transport system permease protein
MHIPDGFLDARTAVAGGALSVAGVGYALRQARRAVPPRRVPLMGLTAAFVFAAQMLNFPVAGGTSGHLMGGVLVAVLLGPGAAVVVLTAVLIVQCLLFADGGLLSLGANVLNMAVAAPLVGYAIYRAVRAAFPGDRGRLLAVFFSAWCSTVVAAILCAGELAWSGTVAWSAAFPAMANVHMLIGLGEGFVTTLVIAAVSRTRPELLDDSVAARPRARDAIVYGFVIAIALALFVSPFASPWPDGLERVAGSLGFEHRATTASQIASPWADYRLGGVESAAMATALAGAMGTVIAFVLAFVVARALVPGTARARAPMPKG